VANIGILAVLDDLHAVAAAIQVIMANQPRISCVTLRLHFPEVGAESLHNSSSFRLPEMNFIRSIARYTTREQAQCGFAKKSLAKFRAFAPATVSHVSSSLTLYLRARSKLSFAPRPF
jgi:hypothetical protein